MATAQSVPDLSSFVGALILLGLAASVLLKPYFMKPYFGIARRVLLALLLVVALLQFWALSQDLRLPIDAATATMLNRFAPVVWVAVVVVGVIAETRWLRFLRNMPPG